MRIGVDFDNTVVCYDEIFHRVTLERGYIPPNIPASKGQVRDYLRRSGKEDVWTEMQGYVYGMRMLDAKPFPGVKEFFAKTKELGVPVAIISHRTRYPYIGPKYDLHVAAVEWLEAQGFFHSEHIALDRSQVFFELTKEKKLSRIIQQRCTHFIDDLPEFLSEPDFPNGVHRILFAPNGNNLSGRNLQHVTSWGEILRKVIGCEL